MAPSRFSAALLLSAPLLAAACPDLPFTGNFSIPTYDLYPESADWDPVSCKLYLSSIYNCTFVEYDPYTNTSEIINLPISNQGTFNYTQYHLDGIDYDSVTGYIYIAAAAYEPFLAAVSGDYSNINLTGPNHIYKYDPSQDKIVADVDMGPAQQQFIKQTGNMTNGYQDMAENSNGDSFVIGSFGNSIVKIPRGSSQGSLWYAPTTYDDHYGFGGIFSTDDDKLVIADQLSGGFVVFDSTASRPRPTYVPMQGLPSDYKPPNTDGLYAPSRYGGTVALLSDDYDGTSVYQSTDGWQTAQYLGLIKKGDDVAAANGYTTATFEMQNRIYMLNLYFQFSLPYETKPTYPFIDITEQVDALVPDVSISVTL